MPKTWDDLAQFNQIIPSEAETWESWTVGNIG